MEKSKRSPFHRAFYVANTMEIFERLAWYGFFTLSSLYMTSPKAQGGLAFTDVERGFLQGMIPFLLYIFPVITGALADRYGYRRMFLVAFSIMCPSYYLLGQVHSFWTFCAVFLMVAVGAACFKPVVVGTVGRSTDDSNRGLGFGVFYTMVNIGGFLGPLVAGYVRAVSWDLVFVMSAVWIAINFIPVLFFYKEPAHDAEKDQRSLKLVLLEAQEVLGNGRLAMMVIPAVVALMVTTKLGIGFGIYLLGVVLWVLLNLGWSALFAANANSQKASAWYREKIRVGDKDFVLYLVIMTGFWVMYNQLFLTLPLYIRDFVDTKDVVDFLAHWLPSSVDFLASVNLDQLSASLPAMADQYALGVDAHGFRQIAYDLLNYKVKVPDEILRNGLIALHNGSATAPQLAQAWAASYRQVNPEYLVNIDFGAIVICQIAMSAFLQRFKALPILVLGTLLFSVGMFLCGLGNQFATGGVVIAFVVLILAFGEMIASPKSQEYVAAIAPKSKTAMFMGYYFVSMALGYLFAGLLSGWSYSVLAKEMQQPLLMWALFALIGGLTGLALIVFNIRIKRKAQQ